MNRQFTTVAKENWFTSCTIPHFGITLVRIATDHSEHSTGRVAENTLYLVKADRVVKADCQQSASSLIEPPRLCYVAKCILIIWKSNAFLEMLIFTL